MLTVCEKVLLDLLVWIAYVNPVPLSQLRAAVLLEHAHDKRIAWMCNEQIVSIV